MKSCAETPRPAGCRKKRGTVRDNSCCVGLLTLLVRRWTCARVQLRERGSKSFARLLSWRSPRSSTSPIKAHLPRVCSSYCPGNSQPSYTSHISISDTMLAPLTAAVGLTCSGLVSGKFTIDLSHSRNVDADSFFLLGSCPTGLTLAYPLLINTHFLDAQGTIISPTAVHVNLSIAQRLTLWERAFKSGLVIPALSLLTAMSLATFALTTDARDDKTAFAKRLSGNWQQRKKLILGSAAFTGSLILFTAIAIRPTNNKLMALREAANAKQSIDIGLAEGLLKRWTQLHNVRVGAALSGFVMALYAFVAL